jgi:hypothetical protein
MRKPVLPSVRYFIASTVSQRATLPQAASREMGEFLTRSKSRDD